jgi:hypothetical protein
MPTTKKSDNIAYLEQMTKNRIVHFVCFETVLESKPFIKRWREFNWSPGSNSDVIIQQSKKSNWFQYITQHGFKTSDGPQFEFFKRRSSSKIVQERIKTTQIGGYTVSQSESREESGPGESKIFVFLADAKADIDVYKTLPFRGKLNIYEPYYMGCNYTYILEYFVKSVYAAALTEYIKKYDNSETGIYSHCAHIKDPAHDEKEHNYVWPSG